MIQRKIVMKLEKLRKNEYPVAVAVNDEYIVFARECMVIQ